MARPVAQTFRLPTSPCLPPSEILHCFSALCSPSRRPQDALSSATSARLPSSPPSSVANHTRFFLLFGSSCQDLPYLATLARPAIMADPAQAQNSIPPQNQAPQSQGTPQQQPSPNPASVSTDSLVCQWQNCGERCPSAEQLYVSPPPATRP